MKPVVAYGSLIYLPNTGYVQGQPLTDWCDARQSGLSDRMTLFLQVLEAVRFAHEKQVIHRDLKPSNILVTQSGQAVRVFRQLRAGVRVAEAGLQHASEVSNRRETRTGLSRIASRSSISGAASQDELAEVRVTPALASGTPLAADWRSAE